MHNGRFSRRSFLVGGSSAWFASRLSSKTIASASFTASIQPSLGFSLYGMKTLSIEDAINTCARIGYSHVELALNAGYASEPSAFSKESRRATAKNLGELKLALPSLMVHMNLTADAQSHATNIALIRSASQVAHDLSPNNPPIVESVLGGSPAKWEQQRSLMVDRLRDWAAAAEMSSIVLGLKAHIGSAVNSPERLLWLLDEVKSTSLQVVYDFSHFELQGIGMEESMRLLLPRTRFVHVKDSQGDASKFQFVLPGEGKTDYVQYFGLLKRHAYVGPVCVEVSGQVFSKPNYDPVAAAEQSYRRLVRAMQAS